MSRSLQFSKIKIILNQFIVLILISHSEELIRQIRDEAINARSFIVSTNLVFGTVRLFKAQVDKLYGIYLINLKIYQVSQTDFLLQIKLE